MVTKPMLETLTKLKVLFKKKHKYWEIKQSKPSLDPSIYVFLQYLYL